MCLLKEMISESYQDSNATTSMIMTNLATLDEHLDKVDDDIVQFNDQVKVLLNSWAARGETTHDLQTNLFNTYPICSDRIVCNNLDNFIFIR